MPPTPTALPAGVPYVFLPDNYSLWASAPFAIQSWNMAGEITTIIQLIFLIAVLAAVALLLKKALTAILTGANEAGSGLAERGITSKVKRRKDAF